MLQLKRLNIILNEWGQDKGKLTGEIEFIGESGKVTVTLKPDDCMKLLPVVGEAVLSASREVAERLTAEALQQLPTDSIKIA